MNESKETVITINTNEEGKLRVKIVFGLEFDREMILASPTGDVADAALAAISGLMQHVGFDQGPETIQMPEITAFHESLTKEEHEELGKALMGKAGELVKEMRDSVEEGSETADALDTLTAAVDGKLKGAVTVH